jgi:hypothetical protein
MEMLSMFVSSHQRDWDIYLPYICFAYRTSVHSSTQDTPFYLMHMRDPAMPEDFSAITQSPISTNQSAEEYKKQMLNNLTKAFEEVRHYGDVIRQKRERLAWDESIQRQFNIGDLVWLYTRSNKKGISPKLTHPWQGPYRIVEVISPLNVKVRSLTGRLVRQLVHITRLKRYETPSRPIDTPNLEGEDNFESDDEEPLRQRRVEPSLPSPAEQLTTPPPLTQPVEELPQVVVDAPQGKDSEEEYEVEDILQQRKRKERDEYLVKWKRYSSDWNTWEPAENLENCKERLQEFQQTQRVQTREVQCSECGFRTSPRGMRIHRMTHRI